MSSEKVGLIHRKIFSQPNDGQALLSGYKGRFYHAQDLLDELRGVLPGQRGFSVMLTVD